MSASFIANSQARSASGRNLGMQTPARFTKADTASSISFSRRALAGGCCIAAMRGSFLASESRSTPSHNSSVRSSSDFVCTDG